MTRKQKHLLTRILVAAVLFLAGSLLHLPVYVEMGVFLVCYAVVGWDIVWKAITNILHGQVFDENFLMTIATIGALILGEHSEGVAVMLFYQVGEWFQSYAVSKSRKSIASLMDIRPDYANIEQDGKLVQVDPDEVQIGSVIVVKPGERIPLDGTIIKGASALDTSALTGESMPREVEPGMEVISGCINQTGILTIQTTKEFGESTVAKILDLVENASDKKGKTENFITRFARYYTPAVVFAALALAVLPPLITGQAFSVWIYRALTFLVISCPCALVISIPLSFFGGIGGASKIGVLVKGSNYLESLAHAEVVVFDKTGTLTKGSFAVSEIHPGGMKEEKILELAAYAEDYSDHPISLSIKKAYGKKIDSSRISNVQEIAGHGVQAVIDGKLVLAGNAKLMEKEHIKYTPSVSIGTVVYLACDGKYAGCIVIEDEIKEDAPTAIKLLKSAGIRKTVMLTGDADAVGQKVAGRLGLDQAYTELLPADKVDRVEDLLKQKSEKGKLVFVGDGINDAPVLARADVGIAMGGLGSDAAIEAADVVLMTDEPSKIAAVMKIARKTIGIANQNIVFALGVKFLVLILGALGYANMWAAVFADVGVSVIAILILLTGADLDHLRHVVDEDLAIADVPGVQGLGGRIDDGLHGDLADHHFHLDLGQQGGIHHGAAVAFAAAFLQAAAHHLGHGHAGHADAVECLLQGVELGQLNDDGNLVHAGIQFRGQGCFLPDLDGRRDLFGAGLGDVILAQVGVFVHFQIGVSGVTDGKARVGTGQAVFVDIQAVDFFLFGNTQADGLFDQGKDHKHGCQDPGRNAHQAQHLHAEEPETMAVEHALAGGEQAGSQGAPGAVDTVDGNRTHGVIDLGHVIEKFYREYAQHTGHDADDGGAEGIDHVTAGSDGHKTGQGAVEGQGHIGFSVAHPGGDQGCHGSQGSGQVGVEADEPRGDHGVVAGHGNGGTAVEAEPAEPQDEHAQGHGGQVVAGDGPGLAVLAVFADAWAQHPGAQAGGDAAHEMYGGGTGEVMEAQLRKPAAAPDPVARDGVHDEADGRRVDAVGTELGALGHGAGNDGGGGGAENGLEHHIHPQRQAAEIVAALDKGVEPADQGAGTGEHDAEAHQPEAGRTDTKIHHVFHQDIAGIFCPGQACLT